jgi:predicted nucleic acid-binding protein
LSSLVLAELDYFVLARLGAQAEKTVLAELSSPAYLLAAFTEDDFHLASEVAIKYGDMQLGLTDASIVVQAARYKTTRILSLDHKHFAAVRPLTGGASFTLLPRDDRA